MPGAYPPAARAPSDDSGYGKRTPVADYPEQNRGGQGVYTIQMTERKGNLAAMKTVGPQHELFIGRRAVRRPPIYGV